MAVDNFLPERSHGGVAGDESARFAEGLRELRRAAGNPSFRSMERLAHFSRTTLSIATTGRQLPSLEVTLGFVAACGGDTAEWEQRWRSADLRLRVPAADPPWPIQPVADGADPEETGCTGDAVTVHARKISITGRRRIVGQVELRYCARAHAAWGRFEGFSGLDHQAHRQHVEIEVRVNRDHDSGLAAFREDYWFDYHWSGLLLTGVGTFWAGATVFFDGEEVATGATDRHLLR